MNKAIDFSFQKYVVLIVIYNNILLFDNKKKLRDKKYKVSINNTLTNH
jgi:hypothetical protein